MKTAGKLAVIAFITMLSGFACSMSPRTANSKVVASGSTGTAFSNFLAVKRGLPGGVSVDPANIDATVTFDYIKISGGNGGAIINGPLTVDISGGVEDLVSYADFLEGQYDTVEIGPMILDLDIDVLLPIQPPLTQHFQYTVSTTIPVDFAPDPPVVIADDGNIIDVNFDFSTFASMMEMYGDDAIVFSGELQSAFEQGLAMMVKFSDGASQ